MTIPEFCFLAIAFLFVLLAGFRLLSAPLRLALRLGANTGLGLLSLIALDLFSPILGIHVAVTLPHALLVGILGPSGLLLLILSQWVLHS